MHDAYMMQGAYSGLWIVLGSVKRHSLGIMDIQGGRSIMVSLSQPRNNIHLYFRLSRWLIIPMGQRIPVRKRWKIEWHKQGMIKSRKTAACFSVDFNCLKFDAKVVLFGRIPVDTLHHRRTMKHVTMGRSVWCESLSVVRRKVMCLDESIEIDTNIYNGKSFCWWSKLCNSEEVNV